MSTIIFNFRKVLADLAIWEPHTFEAIVRTSRERAVADNLLKINEPETDNRIYIKEMDSKKN